MNIDRQLKKALGGNKSSKPMSIGSFKFPKMNFGLPKSKDWDGDGVPNWRDCQPRNTMRQDWAFPKGFDKYKNKGLGLKLVNVPVQEMYILRGHSGMRSSPEVVRAPKYPGKTDRRLLEAGNKKVKYDDIYRKEWRRLKQKKDDGMTITEDEASELASKKKQEEQQKDLAKIKVKLKETELKRRGYNVYPYKIKKVRDEFYTSDEPRWGAKIFFRKPANIHKKDVDNMMQLSNVRHGATTRVEYFKNLVKSIASDEEEVEVQQLQKYDLDSKGINENRHRTLGVKALGAKYMPILVPDNTPQETLDRYPQGYQPELYKPTIKPEDVVIPPSEQQGIKEISKEEKEESEFKEQITEDTIKELDKDTYVSQEPDWWEDDYYDDWDEEDTDEDAESNLEDKENDELR